MLQIPGCSAILTAPAPICRRDVDADTFIGRLYQWAATVTSSGNNMPLALPLRVTRTQEGFEVCRLACLTRYMCQCAWMHASAHGTCTQLLDVIPIEFNFDKLVSCCRCQCCA